MSDMTTDAHRSENNEPQSQEGESSNDFLSPDSAVAFMKSSVAQEKSLVAASKGGAHKDFIQTSIKWMKTLKWALVNFASGGDDQETAEFWIHDFLSYAAPGEADVNHTLDQALKMVREGADSAEVEEMIGQAIEMFDDLMLQTKSVAQPVSNNSASLADACLDLHNYIEKEKGWSPDAFTVGVAEKGQDGVSKLFVYVFDEKGAADMRRMMFPHGDVRWQGYDLEVKATGQPKPAIADIRSL